MSDTSATSRTITPAVAEMVWSLFNDWEGHEYALFAEFGVGQDEHRRMDEEIAKRRREFTAVFGPDREQP